MEGPVFVSVFASTLRLFHENKTLAQTFQVKSSWCVSSAHQGRFSVTDVDKCACLQTSHNHRQPSSSSSSRSFLLHIINIIVLMVMVESIYKKDLQQLLYVPPPYYLKDIFYPFIYLTLTWYQFIFCCILSSPEVGGYVQTGLEPFDTGCDRYETEFFQRVSSGLKTYLSQTKT